MLRLRKRILRVNNHLSPATTVECQSNCLDESIAAHSAKPSSLALDSRSNPFSVEEEIIPVIVIE
jgi:hypothetical protein